MSSRERCSALTPNGPPLVFRAKPFPSAAAESLPQPLLNDSGDHVQAQPSPLHLIDRVARRRLLQLCEGTADEFAETLPHKITIPAGHHRLRQQHGCLLDKRIGRTFRSACHGQRGFISYSAIFENGGYFYILGLARALVLRTADSPRPKKLGATKRHTTSILHLA